MRQRGATLAVTNDLSAGSVCKRRDAVTLARKKGLQPRANERPAGSFSFKLARPYSPVAAPAAAISRTVQRRLPTAAIASPDGLLVSDIARVLPTIENALCDCMWRTQRSVADSNHRTRFNVCYCSVDFDQSRPKARQPNIPEREHNYTDVEPRDVLLILQVFVGRYEHVEFA